MIIGIMPRSQNLLKLNINTTHCSLKVLLFTLGQYQCRVSEIEKQCTKDQRFLSCCFIFSYLRRLTITLATIFFYTIVHSFYSFIFFFILIIYLYLGSIRSPICLSCGQKFYFNSCSLLRRGGLLLDQVITRQKVKQNTMLKIKQ